MTANEPSTGGLPPGPPWPLELLADLHAGALDPAVAAELRPRVEADPQARATLAALDATRDALASLPPLRIPDHVAARIDAALASEAARTATATATLTAPQPAPIVDLAVARERRRRRGLLATTGILTAAAAAVAVIAVANLTGNQTGGDPAAQPTSSTAPQSGPGPAPLALSQSNIGSALDDALGVTDYGPLGQPGKLDACLAANGIDPAGVDPVGSREVSLDGKPGVLIVLPAGANPPRWRLLVVGPDCGAGQPATLADTTTG